MCKPFFYDCFGLKYDVSLYVLAVYGEVDVEVLELLDEVFVDGNTQSGGQAHVAAALGVAHNEVETSQFLSRGGGVFGKNSVERIGQGV